MKKLFVLLTALFTLAQVNAQEKNVIRIATDNTDLILQVAPNGRLYQAYLGDKLLNEKDINNFSPYVKGGSDGSVSTRGWEVYPGSGAEDYFEPAVAITHNDGNPSTILRYVSSEQKAVAGGTALAHECGGGLHGVRDGAGDDPGGRGAGRTRRGGEHRAGVCPDDGTGRGTVKSHTVTKFSLPGTELKCSQREPGALARP